MPWDLESYTLHRCMNCNFNYPSHLSQKIIQHKTVVIQTCFKPFYFNFFGKFMSYFLLCCANAYKNALYLYCNINKKIKKNTFFFITTRGSFALISAKCDQCFFATVYEQWCLFVAFNVISSIFVLYFWCVSIVKYFNILLILNNNVFIE